MSAHGQFLIRCRVSFVFALQSWLAETPSQKESAATPAYMSVFMSCAFPGLVYPAYPAEHTDHDHSDGLDCGMSLPPDAALRSKPSQTYFPLFLPPQAQGTQNTGAAGSS